MAEPVGDGAVVELGCVAELGEGEEAEGGPGPGAAVGDDLARVGCQRPKHRGKGVVGGEVGVVFTNQRAPFEVSGAREVASGPRLVVPT